MTPSFKLYKIDDKSGMLDTIVFDAFEHQYYVIGFENELCKEPYILAKFKDGIEAHLYLQEVIKRRMEYFEMKA